MHFTSTGVTNHISNGNGVDGTYHPSADAEGGFPIAICGMAIRLPGGLETPQQMWDFLIAKGDARGRVPKSRYNVSAYHKKVLQPGTVASEYGYFLDEKVNLATLDVSRFSMSRTEVETSDPAQRLMLEVTRECIDDAGEVNFKGKPIGCYMGCFGEEYLDMLNKDPHQAGTNKPDSFGDFMLSNRISYEMDLRGPCMTIRTACSSAFVGLNEAAKAMQRGECESAIVGGVSLILAPGNTAAMSQSGVLSREGSCKSFSADADGYARAEAINAIFVKPLDAAIRDGNPIRAVIRGTATNFDGKTAGLAHPSSDAQEALIRKAYQTAGISDFSRTAVVECHGTGTPVGDPIETAAIARVFGDFGVHITSVKPNLGHGEGASGITSLIKSVLALEHQTIPPNIKFSKPNPNIPFKERNLTVPVEPTPWPQSKHERISINSFGMGGTNVHVIIDSAASFLANAPAFNGAQSEETPELLLLSANSATALQRTTERLQEWYTKARPNPRDLAYTLALRREHLPHRAFIIAQGDHLGTVSQTRKAPSLPPNLVMVFTGQGAQWPRMGQELLLRRDLSFRSTIRTLDKHLQEQPSPPEWTIEKELLKPAKISRVQQAELSQPLCTAVQIALVDLLFSVGVVPDAVVGHSSGEIAAAYATGALTAKEAIVTSWKRGLAAQKQDKAGAMAAIGLSAEEVFPLLPAGVVVACENSPKSTTISGDAKAVQETVERIRESHPDIVARLLKVDKAYHSHHMREIGSEYHAMIQPVLEGKSPLKPFFSSVTGDRTEQHLDAAYWQKNLESPVLFRSAVARIVEHFDNVAFLEVGPHGALAGPIRQILTESSTSAPYAAVMARGANCVSSYLEALGSLVGMNIAVDLAKLILNGACLADLPRYPWDHEGEYWRESRISREWRQREFPEHPLLGVRQIESSGLEPSWRKMIRADHIPWVRDHKIEDNVIFPAAGYISMVGEAAAQIGGHRNGYALRQVVINAAMVLNDGGEATEVVTNLRPHRLTDSLDSKWWEFTISSYNGNVWMKHCSGQVTFDLDEPEPVEDVQLLPRRLPMRILYDCMDKAGLRFGPLFQRLSDVRTGTVQGLATGNLVDLEIDDDEEYHLHPTVIDAALQLAPIASFRGRIKSSLYRRVPTHINNLIVHRPISRGGITLWASAESAGGSGEVVSQKQQIVVGGKVALHIDGLRISRLEDVETVSSESLQNTARFVWRPHLDFLDKTNLIKPAIDWKLYSPTLNEITYLSMVHTLRYVSDIQPALPHLINYRAWVGDQLQSLQGGEYAQIVNIEQERLQARLDALVEGLRGSPVEAIGQGMRQIATNIADIFSGKIDALEALRTDDILNKMYVPADASDRSEFIQHLAHTKPNLRILEIGAGTGASTTSMLSYLVLPGPLRQPMYSKYTFTDISSGFFVAAKEKFRDERNMEYRTLDISRDPAEQGFGGEKYDLIIATNVIHATSSLSQTLTNVHKLLDPSGRFLLHELHSVNKWPNYVFGILPGWWYGAADGRPDQPYVSPARWESELKAVGFAGLESVSFDSEEPNQLNAIMVAKPSAEPVPSVKKTITLLCDDDASQKAALTQQLERKGYTVHHHRLGEHLPPSQDIVSLLDCDRPFLKDIDETRYHKLQRLLDGLDDAALFWITHSCQASCQNPDYAQVVGLARTIRTEALLDFAVCEVDDFEKSLNVAVDVFAKFQERQGDGVLDPDYEFAVVSGVVHVPRGYPFVLQDELKTEAGAEDQLVLEASKPGRLTSLNWVPHERRDLKSEEVEIELHAMGLNFKDVLGALNVIPYPDEGLGTEGAGIIRRVGSGVQTLKPGDRVMALKAGIFTTHAIVPEKLCVQIPDSLSFDDAATMATVFSTTVESFFNVAHLEKGQSVLIHSATGGVGISAIQLAKMVGAEIYATVGNEEKVKFLMDKFNIPRNRIFQSHDTSFVEGVMRETNGRGVDVALNSLSGELLHATWRCVAEFGTMVEIGKRDLLGGSKLEMDAFLAGRTYSGVYLDLMVVKRMDRIKKNLESIVEFYNQGHITPIRPIQIFDAESAQEAFRVMQQGSHLGKLVISLRHSDSRLKIDTQATIAIREPKLEHSASYLLAGGLGGLGRSIARYLVEHNARRLVFLSRSAGDGPEDADFVRELESLGCAVELVKGSVVNKDDVARAIQLAPNLKGILQASMVLRDETFSRLSYEDWNTATLPKVRGTWNLHEITSQAGIALDFFILLSSMSGTTGLAGQSNYASANTFLDSFVQYRAGLGLHASCIDLGAVQDAGYVANDEALLKRMNLANTNGVSERELLEAVGRAILTSPVKSEPGAGFVDNNTFVLGILTTVPLGSQESRAFWKKDRRIAVYHNASMESDDGSGASSDVLKSFLAKAKVEPSILKTNEAVETLAIEIGKRLFMFLLKSEDDLDVSTSLAALGLDSLVGVEMRSWWRQTIGFDITVLEMLGMGTLEGLGKHAAQGLLKLYGEEAS
ncbi:polyketide synthase [Trichoderma velutinum]